MIISNFKVPLCLLFVCLIFVCKAESSVEIGNHTLFLRANEASLVADGINKFSADLYTVVKVNGGTSNLVYFPFILSEIFAMLKIGTSGDTKKQLKEAFHFPSEPEPDPEPGDATLIRGYKNIFASLDQLKSSRNFTVLTVNRIYMDNTIKILASYEKSMKENFQKIGIVKIDLKNPSAAVSEINNWVAQTTHNKIKNLISPADLLNNPNEVKMVGISAIYFTGQWKHEFRKERTLKETFYLIDKPTPNDNDNDKIQVDTMHQVLNLDMMNLPKLDATVFALPYKGDRLFLLIFLPKTRNGLKTLQVKNLPNPAQIFSGLKSQLVDLSLPKFQIHSTLNLKQSLRKLGVDKIFGKNGDFNGMIGKNNSQFELNLSHSVHSAIIILDENGQTEETTGGAVNSLTSTSTLSGVSKELKVDHPFYFQLLDKHLNLVLASGAVRRP